MNEIYWQSSLKQQQMRIRTRGPVRMHTTSSAMRTRGIIRARGAMPVAATPLAQLVADMRRKAHGSPSAVVIHRWDEPLAQTFLDSLVPLLDMDDAIWLVPQDTVVSIEPPVGWPEAVVLDFSREVDKRTYA